MPPDSDNVVVAGTGDVYVAPEGTALPADLAALIAPWANLGYIGEDGATFTMSRDQEDVNAWQSQDPVRVLVTNEPKTVEFELLEFGSPDVVELALRGGAIAVAAGVATFTPPVAGASDVRALVVEAEDDGATFRFCFAAVALSGDVEWQLVKSDATRFPLEFAVQAGGWKIVTDHPSWVAAAIAGDAIAGAAGREVTADAIVASIESVSDADLELLEADSRVTVKKAVAAEKERRAAALQAG